MHPPPSKRTRASLIPIGGNRNVYGQHYRISAGRQLENAGAGVIGLVQRYALLVVIAGTHVAIFIVNALTSPAPELIGVNG